MWLLYFVNAFQSSILYNLVPFATSDFETHSLLTVIYIVANAMSAAVYIPLAKMLDLWGRAEGFLLMIAFATLGLILMASCGSLSTFCAAQVHLHPPSFVYSSTDRMSQVFYSIGFGGMTYSIDVITADASKLKNRGLAYAFTSSPYMITAFAGAKASEDFYYNISWRWGFGCFAIILPFVAAPLYLNLKYHLRKAEKQGLLKRAKSGRTLTQNIWHYTQEFDGMFLPLLPGHIEHTRLLTLRSCWCLPLRQRSDSLHPSLHSRRQCSQRLVDRLYHCDDRRGLCRPRSVRLV